MILVKWEFLAELLISFLCGGAAFFLRSWIFVRACHWPTCRADDSREVGFYVKILFCSPCILCSWIFFKAWHWPTGLADDSREVGFFN